MSKGIKLTITELCKVVGISRQSYYKYKQLKSEITELHRIIGEKQILLDLQEKLIELAEVEYKVDIKKS